MKKYYDLIEVAHDISVSVEDLVRYAADGELTVFVVAQDWPASSTKGLDDTVLAGPVNLVASDLLRSMNADFTMVRQVSLPDSDCCLTLSTPEEVRRGGHFVTGEEIERFKKGLGQPSPDWDSTNPPYLDSSNQYFAKELDLAVRVWIEQYVLGGFDKSRGHVPQIEEWLLKNYPKQEQAARSRIAKVANPNKVGGMSKAK
jgi:hypothetical protein